MPCDSKGAVWVLGSVMVADIPTIDLIDFLRTQECMGNATDTSCVKSWSENSYPESATFVGAS